MVSFVKELIIQRFGKNYHASGRKLYHLSVYDFPNLLMELLTLQQRIPL